VPRLIVIKGADEGKQFELAGPVLGIGRDKTNAVWLHDTEVSRRHAELRRTEAGGYVVADVGSVNGTLLNTKPVNGEAPLQPGDHVQVGQSILVYSAGRTEGPPAGDLAERIRMVTSRQDLELSSAIIKTIGENAGSQILARPDKAGTDWLKTRLANLATMYEASQAVSHILDLDQLLERIMDLVFRSIEADRGCVMVRNHDSGEFEPKAVRYREGVSRVEKISISRTIMDYSLGERKGVLVADAAQDERFSAGQSIVRFNIREAICVPMKGRHETVGVLWLDTRSGAKEVVARGNPAGKFTEDHLALAIAIAHQAALAVEETRYHQALVSAERLAAVGQTVAAVSHHIKNILQGLQSGGDLIRMGLSDGNDSFVRKGWAITEKSQSKITELVKDMLSYSKEREPAIEPTDLNRLVTEVLDLVRGRADAQKVQMEVRLSAGLPPAPIDPEGIHRALLNIVTNALDALEGRPTPYLGVQTILEADPSWVRVVVMDHGGGIPPEKLNDIFKPFVSTKGERGTGLGLPVSRKILREHGGDISVESKPGVGSKFILRLPMRSPFSPDLNSTLVDQPLPDPGPPD
jgi:signal transduction histidine kinase